MTQNKNDIIRNIAITTGALYFTRDSSYQNISFTDTSKLSYFYIILNKINKATPGHLSEYMHQLAYSIKHWSLFARYLMAKDQLLVTIIIDEIVVATHIFPNSSKIIQQETIIDIINKGQIND